jgi:hypothetical protein
MCMKVFLAFGKKIAIRFFQNQVKDPAFWFTIKLYRQKLFKINNCFKREERKVSFGYVELL